MKNSKALIPTIKFLNQSTKKLTIKMALFIKAPGLKDFEKDGEISSAPLVINTLGCIKMINEMGGDLTISRMVMKQEASGKMIAEMDTLKSTGLAKEISVDFSRLM